MYDSEPYIMIKNKIRPMETNILLYFEFDINLSVSDIIASRNRINKCCFYFALITCYQINLAILPNPPLPLCKRIFLQHLPILRKRRVTYGTFYCEKVSRRSEAFFSELVKATKKAFHAGIQSRAI